MEMMATINQRRKLEGDDGVGDGVSTRCAEDIEVGCMGGGCGGGGGTPCTMVNPSIKGGWRAGLSSLLSSVKGNGDDSGAVSMNEGGPIVGDG
jgi:hypothetical protein